MAKSPVASKKGVRLGAGHEIDPAAVIGEPSPRLKAQAPLELGPKARVRSGTVIYAGSKIGAGLETGHNSVIREENTIGRDFRIWNNSTIDYGCRIGDGVKVHCNCYIAQFTTLESDVFLAPGVTLANDLYPGDAGSAKVMRGPHLERGVKVGVNATILPYVRVGAGSMIGSGAVVTKDVPPGSIAVGNPARVVGKVSESQERWRRRLTEAAR